MERCRQRGVARPAGRPGSAGGRHAMGTPGEISCEIGGVADNI